MFRPFSRSIIYMAFAVVWTLLGGTFACTAVAETVRVGNILLEYGEKGHNPLQRASAEGYLTKPSYYNEMTISAPLSQDQKQQIQQATSYFSPFTAHLNPGVTTKIYAGYSYQEKGTAFAYNPVGDMKLSGLSPNGSLYDTFMNGRPVPGYPDYLASNIIIFQDPSYSTTPTRVLLDDASMMSSMLHELGHAFGIMADYKVTNPNDKDLGTEGIFTASKFTAWNAHLYDVFGKQAKPGMNIAMDASSSSQSRPGVFQIFAQSSVAADIAGYRYPTFKGPNVDALTGGKGMPVMGGFSNDGSGLDGANGLGHPGIMNSIMSYGLIRNMPFTEMELAAFQDMGYAFDRSQYFGKSYYYEVGGNTQTNMRGFGTAAAPNTTLFGLGTHILRDKLTLTQQGDIYANGYGGGGVRIDGVSNTLFLPKGVTVAADGTMGTGLLVSYGSKNAITLDGTVRATGAGGIGAHFGVKAVGGKVYSYVTEIDLGSKTNIQELHEAKRIVREMNGPLVSNFSISGTLAGREAAIKIENDAHVAAINLLPGACIEGDIVSLWSNAGYVSEDGKIDDTDPSSHSSGKYTDIVIGSAGVNTGQVSMTGDIRGIAAVKNSLEIKQKGGVFRFNGKADVSTWNIAPGATLSGNNTITLRDVTKPLHNAGTIAPGNSIGRITINGDFTNSGLLAMEFNGKGSTDTLAVKGAFQHDASGTVSLSPVRDYYNGSLTIDTTNMFQGGTGSSLPTNITAFTPAASPTLNMNMVQSTPGVLTINTTRPADAYSQYANSGNAARVGSALHGLSGVAQGEMRDMLAQLDFSAADGSGVGAALPQLTAVSYAQAAQASTEANLGIGRMALAHLRAAAGESATAKGQTQGLSAGDSVSQWSAFVMPFGGGSVQQSHEGVSGYNSSQAGLMGGLFRQTEEMRLGLYSAFSRRQADMWTVAGAQARSTALHVGGSALWSEDSSGVGSGWQVWGQVQLGVENTDMRRSVDVAGYARQNSSFYTSFNGVAQLGGAYLWRADAFSFGPKAGLEYAFNALPAITEEDGGASRLGIDAYTLHDLRGVAGITARWSADMGEGRKAQAHLDVAWRQDMLSEHSDMQAHFVGYDSYSFANRVEREGQGSLGLTGGVEVSLRQDVTLSAQVEADVLRPGYSSVGGGLSLRWDF